jgi:hypothetical protein
MRLTAQLAVLESRAGDASGEEFEVMKGGDPVRVLLGDGFALLGHAQIAAD